MSSDPNASSAFTLNYAAVVRRSVALQQAKRASKEEGVAPSRDAQRDGVAEQCAAVTAISPREEAPLAPTAPRTSALTSPMAVHAKPYVPSYLAALKTQSSTVLLDGVPVNVNKAQRQTNTEWCSSTNISNSLLEPDDTISSWADDDECFLESIGRGPSAAAARKLDSTLPRTENPQGVVQHQIATAQPFPQHPQHQGHARGRGRKGGFQDWRKRGWKHVESGRNSGPVNNECPASSDPHGARLAAPHRRSRGSGHGGAGEHHRQASPTDVSGGRFDVLADPKIMRHL